MRKTIVSLLKAVGLYTTSLLLYDIGSRPYRYFKKIRLPYILKKESARLMCLPIGNNCAKENGDRINLVQLSTYDNFGGAALVAFRLHKAYTRLGHESTMLVGNKLSDDSRVVGIVDPKKDSYYSAVCSKEGWHYFNYLSSFDIPEIAQFKNADILHMHNLHGDYFNYLALPGLTRLKPTVWTLHDMQSLTGNCAFSYGCERWETGCGDCPQLGSYPEKDTTDFMWLTKKELFRKAKLDIVVPSKWLYDIVKKSMLADKEIHLVYNGVDTETFHPHFKDEVRKKLNIPQGKTVFITSAAGGSKNPQKGRTYLLEALTRIPHKDEIVFVSIGDTNLNPIIEGLEWINTGHIFSEQELSEWYSAADIFLYPSIADNCPLAILEAMACGLPVVTFDTGGIPELVRHMETGYIAKHRDVDDFVRGIETYIWDEGRRKSAGKRARAIAEKDFTVDKMAKSYLELYYKCYQQRFNKN